MTEEELKEKVRDLCEHDPDTMDKIRDDKEQMRLRTRYMNRQMRMR